ncbi:MAG: SRPBCC family protein [Phycisphaerales bacterium]
MQIACSEYIAAPPEQVFAMSSDVERWPETVSAITKTEILTPGRDAKVGVGTVFRETRIMFGKEASETMTIARFEPPRGYTFTASSHGCNYETTFTFTPEGPGTRVDMHFKGEPQTFMSKVMGAVMAPMLKGTMVKCIRKDLLDMKQTLEGNSAAATA